MSIAEEKVEDNTHFCRRVALMSLVRYWRILLQVFLRHRLVQIPRDNLPFRPHSLNLVVRIRPQEGVLLSRSKSSAIASNGCCCSWSARYGWGRGGRGRVGQGGEEGMEEGVEDLGKRGSAVLVEIVGEGESRGGIEGDHASDEGLANHRVSEVSNSALKSDPP